MDKTKTKKVVKERYSSIAQTNGSCCSSSCCDSGNLIAIGRKIGYSEDDLRNVPETANMGLGCGNPVALASLKNGETILDLGLEAESMSFSQLKKSDLQEELLV